MSSLKIDPVVLGVGGGYQFQASVMREACAGEGSGIDTSGIPPY